MALAPGTRLGAYEVVAPLGVGGMGEVYRARDLRLGREVAVKVLPAEFASNPDHLARFEREARTVAGLNHPNIVVLHSIEEVEGTRFLTMELVRGRSLTELVASGGLPPTRLLNLSIPLADALVAAHECGVVHRDLKPGNVMVTREGRVKVLDFGLAKPSPPAPGADLSRAETRAAPISTAGQMLGTLPYMAPEQLRGEEVDARTDLFSLGVLLYELAAGRRPFTGRTAPDIGSSILRDTPEPLSRVRGDLPIEFVRIVDRCLEKDPRERFQTALEVSNELRHLRRALERGEAEIPGAPETVPVASIAVLPFVNRSASAEDEYFSDGLADELLNLLAKIKGLRVPARTSSFHFKGANVPVAEIGRTLNVETVLDGSVRKAGNRVRIAVQLVKVSDGYHLWSEVYDRTLEDIFAVQDEIARSVVKELRATLLGQEADSDASGRARAEVAQAAKGRGSDPEAHRLYLLAQHLIGLSTRDGNAKAIGYLEQAVGRDPEFALAWAQLGGAYSIAADQGWIPVEEGYRRARDAVKRSLALEPDLAEGHLRRARRQMVHDWDWRGAEASYARALELAPGNAVVLRGAAALATNLGRLDEAVELHRRALERDPLSSACYSSLGLSLHAAGRFAEAEEAFRKSLELAPQRVITRALLALTLLARERGGEALAEALREPDDAFRLSVLAIVHHVSGRPEESDAALRELIESCAQDSAFQIAEVHAARGEVDAAFEWLERAYVQRDGGLSSMRVDPPLRSLHGDPRWGALLERMGLAR